MPATDAPALPVGFWSTPDGVLHVDPGAWLRSAGFADTSVNRLIVAKTTRRVAAELYPGQDLIQH